MKRTIAMILSLGMLLGMLTGCQTAPSGGDTTQTENQVPTQSAEEQAVLKILLIGNSHSNDAFQMLKEVFEKEAPQQELVLAYLYYSGCPMSKHASFIKEGKPEYEYYKNVDGAWRKRGAATVKMALQDEQWDIVSLQQMNREIGDEKAYVAEHFWTVIDHIYANQKVAPKLYFHAPWSNPDNYELYLDDNAPLGLGKSSWRIDHERLFADADGKYSQRLMYEKQMEMLQKYLVDSTSFLQKNYFDTIVATATPIQYAQDVLGLTHQQLYRDYTHLNDFGRLLAGYFWYAKLMGLSSIDAVHVDNIPKNLHFEKSQYPALPDFAITQEMKDVIIKSVNWALEHPYEVPTQ